MTFSKVKSREKKTLVMRVFLSAKNLTKEIFVTKKLLVIIVIK